MILRPYLVQYEFFRSLEQYIPPSVRLAKKNDDVNARNTVSPSDPEQQNILPSNTPNLTHTKVLTARMVSIATILDVKCGFPHIFRKRHVQLDGTTLTFRDIEAVAKYISNSKLWNGTPSSSSASSSTVATSSVTPQRAPLPPNAATSTTNDKIASSLQKSRHLLLVQDKNGPRIPPPLWQFDFSHGKVSNSRTPLTLKVTNTESVICYLSFRNEDDLSVWVKHIMLNLKVELAQDWHADTSKLMKNMLQSTHATTPASIAPPTPIVPLHQQQRSVPSERKV